jgi:hypothetical protein
LGLWALQQSGFIEVLAGLGINGAQRTTMIGALISRRAAPGTELAAHHWLGQTSGLGELLEVAYETLPLMSLVCLTATVIPSFIRIGFLIKMMW